MILNWFTPPKFNIAPEKLIVGRLSSILGWPTFRDFLGGYVKLPGNMFLGRISSLGIRKKVQVDGEEENLKLYATEARQWKVNLKASMVSTGGGFNDFFLTFP